MWRRTLESIYFGATLAGQKTSKFDCYPDSCLGTTVFIILRPAITMGEYLSAIHTGEIGGRWGDHPSNNPTYITLSLLHFFFKYNSFKLPNNNNKTTKKQCTGEIGGRRGDLPSNNPNTHYPFPSAKKIVNTTHASYPATKKQQTNNVGLR